MSRIQLNTDIDTVLNDQVADNSITPSVQASMHKKVADYAESIAPTIPTLALVATTGNYNDLLDKPTISVLPTLTEGTVNGDLVTPTSAGAPLTFDINRLNISTFGVNAFYLPNNPTLGKELIIKTLGQQFYYIFGRQDGLGLLILYNGRESNSLKINPNSVVKFTFFDNVWAVQYVSNENQKENFSGNATPYTIQKKFTELNTVNGNDSYFLPTDAVLGDEFFVRPNNDSNILSNGGISWFGLNNISNNLIIKGNSFWKFLCLGDNYWFAVLLKGLPMKVNDQVIDNDNVNLAKPNSNTTIALTKSYLVSLFPYPEYPIGFKLYCPNIAGGGKVYTQINNATWISENIPTIMT